MTNQGESTPGTSKELNYKASIVFGTGKMGASPIS